MEGFETVCIRCNLPIDDHSEGRMRKCLKILSVQGRKSNGGTLL
jgi:hypothetical protein